MRDGYSAFTREFMSLTGVDLSSYSQSQVLRRLTAFCLKHRIGSLGALLVALKEDPDLLADCLARLTINVSEFYRDRPYWQALKAKVLELAGSRLPLRLWSAGCAGGEEPYSLAFLLFGHLPRSGREILASDLSLRALAGAEAGVYPPKAVKNLTPEEIELFFYPAETDLLKVKNFLRQGIKFFHHNLLLDPYPSDLDVVLCRNVIIYFNEQAKKQVLAKAVGSLNLGGLLFVGGSEQIMAPGDFGLEREDVYIYRKITA